MSEFNKEIAYHLVHHGGVWANVAMNLVKKAKEYEEPVFSENSVKLKMFLMLNGLSFLAQEAAREYINRAEELNRTD